MTTPPSARNHPEGTAFVLRENATLTARVKFRSVSQWGLTVTARAEPGSDAAWPTLRIELDGVPAQTLVVHDRRAMSYWLRFVAEPGFADLNLSMARADAATHGATVVIERVEIVPL